MILMVYHFFFQKGEHLVYFYGMIWSMVQKSCYCKPVGIVKTDNVQFLNHSTCCRICFFVWGGSSIFSALLVLFESLFGDDMTILPCFYLGVVYER